MNQPLREKLKELNNMLTPMRHLYQTPFKPNPIRCTASAATALYVGAVVKLVSASASTSLYPEVEVQTTYTGTVFGVVVDMDMTGESYDSLPYKTASTADVRDVLVITDPAVVYAVKEDAVGGALTLAAKGGTIRIATNDTGNAATGLSNTVLDSSTINHSTSDMFRVIGPNRDVENTVGSASTVWEVIVNASQTLPGAAANGV